MEWSPFEASLTKARKRGADVPALDQKVAPHDDLLDIWQAFFELSASRTAGYTGADPLSPANIKAYLDIHSVIDSDDRRRYYELLTAMDLEFMRHVRSKQNDGEKNTTPSN